MTINSSNTKADLSVQCNIGGKCFVITIYSGLTFDSPPMSLQCAKKKQRRLNGLARVVEYMCQFA